MGPFASYAIYLGIGVYFQISQGCDVIKSHSIAIYKNFTSQNIFYEAEGKWSLAIKELVIGLSTQNYAVKYPQDPKALDEKKYDRKYKSI